MTGRNKIKIKIMKSRIIILTVVLLLIPIFIGATPLNLAVKMGAGCPFKPGPMLERCNPTVIHANSNPGDLILMSYSISSISPTLTALQGIRVDIVMAMFSLDAMAVFPLRC